MFSIDFSASGDSRQYRGTGWSEPEPDFVWAIGPQSRLRLPPVAVPGDMILELDVNPAIVPGLVEVQSLLVRVNGTAVGAVLLTGLSRARFRIEACMLAVGKPVTLTFEHPGHVRIDWMAGRGDARPLSVSFFALRLYSASSLAAVQESEPLLRPHEKQLDAEPAPGWPSFPPCVERRRTYRLRGALADGVTLDDGWLSAQDEVWTAAAVSRLMLPALHRFTPNLIRITLEPLRLNTVCEAQRITILLNGRVLGQFRTGEATSLGLPLPPDLPHDRPLVLTFVTPDAVDVAAFANGMPGRVVGFAVHEIALEALPAHALSTLPPRADCAEPAGPARCAGEFLNETLDELPTAIERKFGASLQHILRDFESLGENCSFGLVQRKSGVEVLGLLRFANTKLISLLHGLDEEFAAARSPDESRIDLDKAEPREYVLRLPRYGIRWHTTVHEGEADAELVFEQHAGKLRYLQRKFCEGIRAGRKIYVIVRSDPHKVGVVGSGWASNPIYELKPDPLGLAEALSVYAALSREVQNTLLYLVPACDGHPSGTVEQLAPGLLRGYLGNFFISDNPAQRDHADWVRVAANAWLLLHGERDQVIPRTQLRSDDLAEFRQARAS
jgi:hypothetical protein